MSFPAGLFHLDNVTGIVAVAKSLDREVNHTVRFQVRAQDQSEPFYSDDAEVIVMITDVNDNAPVIEPKEMKVVVSEVRFYNTWHFVRVCSLTSQGRSGVQPLQVFYFKGRPYWNIHCGCKRHGQRFFKQC